MSYKTNFAGFSNKSPKIAFIPVFKGLNELAYSIPFPDPSKRVQDPSRPPKHPFSEGG